MPNRRDFIAGLLGGAFAAATFPRPCLFAQENKQPIPGPDLAPTGPVRELFSIRQITSGPKYHWRGYYDKFLTDPNDRLLIYNAVDFQHRSPTAEDGIDTGIIDLENGNAMIPLGRSKAWNWQQGCMLQWIPGSKDEVIWNDRENDRFVAHRCNVRTQKIETLPNPIYALSPDGKWAVYPDFRRLNRTRPGYGYAGIPDPNTGIGAPDNAGIWKMDLANGKSELIIPFAAMLDLPHTEPYPEDAVHWFNHLLVSPDGKRFLFLHRWSGTGIRSWKTRLLTAAADGSDLFVLNPYNHTSHLVWRDPEHITAFASYAEVKNAYIVFKDKTHEIDTYGLGIITGDGHNTYLPGTSDEWMISDTYPDKTPNRNQNLYLYHIPSDTRIWLGHFPAPKVDTAEWRCDLHPCAARNGRFLTVDSMHGDQGRQIYMLDNLPAVLAHSGVKQFLHD